MADTSDAPTLPRNDRIEWPTLGLAALIYGGWLSLTWWHDRLPLWVLIPAGAWVVAWQNSLQHEIIHGHPTRSRWFNTALGFAPLSLWVPFERYRTTHLAHHHDERLTDPLDDPESYYWTAAGWAGLSPLGRALVRAQTTLAGRLIVGPFWSMARFFTSELTAIRAGDRRLARIWAGHGLAVALVLTWVLIIAAMPLWLYLLAFVYAGTSLSMLRSFAEHRAHPSVPQRTAIVERANVLGLLFLYNNLHVVHHRWPTVPWYRLPRLYRDQRAALIAEAGGPVYGGYVDVARRFLVRAHDRPVHPLWGERPRTEVDRAAQGWPTTAKDASPLP